MSFVEALLGANEILCVPSGSALALIIVDDPDAYLGVSLITGPTKHGALWIENLAGEVACIAVRTSYCCATVIRQRFGPLMRQQGSALSWDSMDGLRVTAKCREFTLCPAVCGFKTLDFLHNV